MTAMAQISNEYAEALFALALETGSVKEYSEALDIDCSVDKSLIGGVKVTVDGKVIDGSVKQKLHELKGAMYR